jgi:hypothetical protein
MFKIINTLNSLVWLYKLFKIFSFATCDMIFKLARILQYFILNLQLKRIKIVILILKIRIKGTLANVIVYTLNWLNEIGNYFLTNLSLLHEIRHRHLNIGYIFHDDSFFIFHIHFFEQILWSLRRNLFFDFGYWYIIIT